MKFESGIKNTAYWKRFWLRAALFVTLLAAGAIAAGFLGVKGDVAGAVTDVAGVLVFFGFIGAYLRRPKAEGR